MSYTSFIKSLFTRDVIFEGHQLGASDTPSVSDSESLPPDKGPLFNVPSLLQAKHIVEEYKELKNRGLLKDSGSENGSSWGVPQ